jgi:DNA sulfur modification protein DndD
LFFFDGEKIKHYAEAQRSRELLERGVQSLLGIDVVDQLDIDLKALEARIAKAEKGNDDDQARKQLEQEVADRTAEVDRLSEQIASLRTEADRLERRYDTFDRHYAEAGGELYDRHKELDAERKGLDARLRAAKDVLIGLSGSALPFALVPNLLARTQLQMRVEIEVTGARTALERLDDQQDRLLDRLSGRRVAARTKASIEDFFREERVELEKVAEVPAYLGSSHEDYLSASSLTEQKLPELESQAHDALQNYEELESRLEQLDRQLASVPDKAAIADLRAQREAAKHELAVTIGKIEQTQEDLRLAKVHLQEAEQSLHKHLVEQFEKRSEVEDRARVMKHAERVRGTLASFRARLIKRRVAQLERLILESYVDLMRKSGMVSRISIDPETFELSLFNSEGTRVLPDWLSAGERQLLVVSILWGLARASGRSLPVIVDTPLGRLDSLHRDNLVKHYFPHASHQVILLSTDEEIIGHTLRALEPAIGHKYRLVYDDDADATRIEPGYFKEQVSAN